MKRLLNLFLVLFALTLVSACQTPETTTVDPSIELERQAYQRLIEAETLSGMGDYHGQIIRTDGSLNLPTEYNGVTIVYQSRNTEIISNQGVVTRPDSCWIHSKDQQGLVDYPNLNDNWPIVVDVTMSYLGQIRTAKLMFVVSPSDGYTCDKYLGTK